MQDVRGLMFHTRLHSTQYLQGKNWRYLYDFKLWA